MSPGGRCGLWSDESPSRRHRIWGLAPSVRVGRGSPAAPRGTQAELAERAGLKQPAVARFEAGGAMPTIPMLERLAEHQARTSSRS
ncbi:helix-turn-helix domain-containing protein [Nonomuraea sp. NPDC050547]|uniref:helix-turn-helix domain-containing protein n=1 Tax=Nonomuraea sp. NPDC050547 TaxID=3364368 RepID=UPI0037B3CEC8